MDHLIPSRRLDLVLINMKKRTCHLVDFAISANHREKIKESEKIDKYLDLARKLKKLWNGSVTVIPTIIVVLGTIPKSLEEKKTGGIGNQKKSRDRSDC